MPSFSDNCFGSEELLDTIGVLKDTLFTVVAEACFQRHSISFNAVWPEILERSPARAGFLLGCFPLGGMNPRIERTIHVGPKRQPSWRLRNWRDSLFLTR